MPANPSGPDDTGPDDRGPARFADGGSVAGPRGDGLIPVAPCGYTLQPAGLRNPDTSQVPVVSTDPAAPDPAKHAEPVELPLPVHTTRPGGRTARCGNVGGPLVPWEQVVDPDHPAVFDCPACWLDCSGGAEPMGGSAPANPPGSAPGDAGGGGRP